VKPLLFGTLMERLNRPAYAAALRWLAPRAGARVLEIGFGTGALVEMLVTAGADVRVAGVDPTPTMLEVASHRAAIAAAGDRVDLRLGSDCPLPWEDRAFDAVAALHSFQFWPDARASLREIRRVLRPGGRLVLILRDHSRNAPVWLPNPISRGGSEAADTAALLRELGFTVAAGDRVGASAVLVADAPDHEEQG